MGEPIYTLSVYWKDWWDGATAAWRAKGAASSSDALIDLTGNGYDLNYDNFPSTNWNTTTGWAADGAGYFDTGILPALEQTIYVAFKGTSDTGSNAELIGARELISGTQRQHYLRNRGGVTGLQYNFQDNVQAVGTFYADGVVAMNKNGFWLDGVKLYTTDISTEYEFTLSMYLMALNNNSVAANILPNGYITAACIVNETETDAIVEQRSLAMLKTGVDDDFPFRSNQFIGKTMITHKVLSWSTETGQYNYFSSNNRGFETAQIGRANFVIDNSDNKFDPYNTESELYGYIEPDKFFFFSVVPDPDVPGTEYDIMTGMIRDIKLNRKERTAELICEGMEAWLNDRVPQIPTQVGKRHDEIIDEILDAVDYPYEQLGISSAIAFQAPDTIDYWYPTGKTAKREIEDITHAGLGYFYIRQDGRPVYLSRRVFDAPTDFDEDDFLKDIDLTMPWEWQRNIVETGITVYTEGTTNSVIWTLADEVSVGSSDTIYLYPVYRFGGVNSPAIDVIDPVATTDYLFNALSGGGGSDLTTDLSVTLDDYGTGARLTITNSGATSGFITHLQLRGTPLIVQDKTGITATGTSASTKPKPLYIDSLWLQDYDNAFGLADFLVKWLSTPQAFIICSLENRPVLQFSRELFERIAVSFPTLGIDETYRILSIRHATMNSVNAVKTTFKLVPEYSSGLNYWRLGISLLGVDTILVW